MLSIISNVSFCIIVFHLLNSFLRACAPQQKNLLLSTAKCLLDDSHLLLYVIVIQTC